MSSEAPWQPLEEGEINPEYAALTMASRAALPIAVYANDVYQVSVYAIGGPNVKPEDQMLHLSLKRHDRAAVHDWRHLQAIKNEIAGPERVAVEIYPPESGLVDTSNQYHLWVFPPGTELPFGFDERLVFSDAQVMMFNAGNSRGEHKGRQRPYQPGLPVALGRNSQPGAYADPMNDLVSGMHQKVPGL